MSSCLNTYGEAIILQILLAGWIQRHQQQVISYLQVENRVLKAQLGGRRLRLTGTERRRLAALAHPLGRTRLQEVATIATPDTLLCWYQRLIAQKFDGSRHRRQFGRPRVTEELEQLVVRIAEENPTWGYRRIQSALANLAKLVWRPPATRVYRHHLAETSHGGATQGLDMRSTSHMTSRCGLDLHVADQALAPLPLPD